MVKRYEPNLNTNESMYAFTDCYDGAFVEMFERESGKYVTYEDYQKLQEQLGKAEAVLKEYADPETWKNVGEYGVDTWILRDDQGNLARQYFKEKENK